MENFESIRADKRKGRGAGTNRASRYDALSRVGIDDGWGFDPADGIAEATVRTEVRDEVARKIVTRNTSPDISFDRSINPYRGCEHGCIYCFARPTHAYLGLSPGLDFETRLVARPNAAERLEAELSAKSYQPRAIAIGTNTDPYQPIERDREIMRDILKVLLRFKHPVTIVTKGTLIERDIDLLSELTQLELVRVGISVTTLDPDLSRKMEPRVPLPARRLAAIARLAAANVPVHVMASPMIPGLTDHELERILEAAAKAGAWAASTIGLRLPQEVAPLFQDWLQEHVPGRAAHVLNRVRELHGGKLYDAEWGKRFTGSGIWAELLQKRFNVACKRFGLVKARGVDQLSTTQFSVPEKVGDQLELF